MTVKPDQNYTVKQAIETFATLEDYLSFILSQAFEALSLDVRYAKVQVSARPELSQFQCNGAMPLAKLMRKSPMEIAKVICGQLEKKPIFKSISAIKPGFINLNLSDRFIADWLNEIAQDSRFGCKKADKPTKIILDFGGPNIAKPLHIGHIRSPLIGDCLQRVFRFCGDEVLSDVHLGDWGTQMGMLIEEIRLMDPELPYFDPDFTGPYPDNSPVSVDALSQIYPKASARCKADEKALEKARLATAELQAGSPGYHALWCHFVNVSVAALKKDYAELGVHFDLWKGESDVQPLIAPMVQKALEKKAAQKSEGAIIVPLAKDADDKMPPLILIKSDGAVMYGTTDLATILERVNHYQAEKIVYVVDKRQRLHFKQVFAAAEKMGIRQGTELRHIGFGTLNGKDGKPFKTREGGVMRLSTLIDEAKSRAGVRDIEGVSLKERERITHNIALATVKFADLANVYTSDYVFDLDKFSRYEGKTGPYLLYSAVRIKSILRKVGECGNVEIQCATNRAERKLQLMLMQLPNAVYKACAQCEPHHLCEYSYQIASLFNKFYGESPIATETDQSLKRARVALCVLTLRQLELVLGLLGIEIPDKM